MYSGKRVLVILNPSSGREVATTVSSRVEDALGRHGASHVTMRFTAGPDDALAWAATAAESDFDIVLAGGGDGTVADVAHGVLGQARKLTIGIIPLGTGNGLARVLGIPMDPVAAVDEMARGGLADLDVISVVSHDRTSLLFLGAGLDAETRRMSAQLTLAFAPAALLTLMTGISAARLRPFGAPAAGRAGRGMSRKANRNTPTAFNAITAR